ncbi:cytochrome P450 [Occultella gossypii]|uniref:Cytochrome P450 n=1 Tax=Occultella gossypii TaxID=2800820 RepID=A0ABS7S485_9MICO|nr:cytochrome P450 [Occultella gossypii]MBZ2195164.1 cytochrome P450 [Occultella gossypii]
MTVLSYRPAEVLGRCHDRFGPVLRVGGRRGFAYVRGEAANAAVFAASDRFRWEEAFAGLVPVDGPTSMIVSDGAQHRRRRRLVQPAMHHRQVAHYVQIMAATADEAIDGLRPGTDADAYAVFRGAIRRSTIHALFGPDLAADADALGRSLQPLLDLVDGLPAATDWHRRLRTPAWQRAGRARATLDRRIRAEIARTRLLGPRAGDHVLATLVNGRDDDGDGLTDREIRDQVVTLIAAGYETTSSAMAWAIYSLATEPAVWATARAEVRDAVGDRPPGPGDLRDLPYLAAVVNETLRLYPPAVVTARYVAQDFEVEGRLIRAGATLLLSPYLTHRMPEYWDRPLQFRPQRWMPGSAEYTKPGPARYLPFGGGPHRCIGATMATTELIVMLARVVARLDLTLPAQRIRPTGFAAMRPRDGLRVHVTARR